MSFPHLQQSLLLTAQRPVLLTRDGSLCWGCTMRVIFSWPLHEIGENREIKKIPQGHIPRKSQCWALN